MLAATIPWDIFLGLGIFWLSFKIAEWGLKRLSGLRGDDKNVGWFVWPVVFVVWFPMMLAVISLMDLW